jgi:hypothetical protein
MSNVDTSDPTPPPSCDACGKIADTCHVMLFGVDRWLCWECYVNRYSVDTKVTIETHVKEWDILPPVICGKS